MMYDLIAEGHDLQIIMVVLADCDPQFGSTGVYKDTGIETIAAIKKLVSAEPFQNRKDKKTPLGNGIE